MAVQWQAPGRKPQLQCTGQRQAAPWVAPPPSALKPLTILAPRPAAAAAPEAGAALLGNDEPALHGSGLEVEVGSTVP